MLRKFRPAVGIAGKLRGVFLLHEILRTAGGKLGLDSVHRWIDMCNAILWFGVGAGAFLFIEVLCLAFIVSRRGGQWN